MTTLSAARIDELRCAHYNATVHYLRKHGDHQLILGIKPDGELPDYQAGQYTSIGLGWWESVPEGAGTPDPDPEQAEAMIVRPFSISHPILAADGSLLKKEDEDSLEFYVTLPTNSPKPPALTVRLFELKPGDRIFLDSKIGGGTTLEGVDADSLVLFCATGTGESPHNAMIAELLGGRHRGPIVAAVCARHLEQLAYLETHRKVETLAENYKYIAISTRDSSGPKTYLQDLLTSGQLEQRIGRQLDPADTDVYLCGNPFMIDPPAQDAGQGRPGMVQLLESRGFSVHSPDSPGTIHYDRYW